VSARWAFEETLRYVEEREQFDQPIGEFQAAQHRLADVATKLEPSRLLVYRALSREGLPSRYESSMAKVYTAEVGQEVVDAALRTRVPPVTSARPRSRTCTGRSSTTGSPAARTTPTGT
jgi:alkylation response protein AidB-like acyl-CoA dehydrogenase